MPGVVTDRNLTIPGCRLSERRLLGVGFLMPQKMPSTMETRGCSPRNEFSVWSVGGVGILSGRPLGALGGLS